MVAKICDKCETRFSSNFCPNCGRNYDEIEVIIPDTFDSYVHGNKETGYSKCEELGIDPESKLGEKLIYINYEVKIVYEIIRDEIKAIQVDAGDGQGLQNLVPIKK